MSSLISWYCTTSAWICLGRPRLSILGTVRSITLRVTLFASLLWTSTNQRRQPVHRQMSFFLSRLDTRRVPQTIIISVVSILLLLFTFIAQHSLPHVRASLIMASSTFSFQPGRTLLVKHDPQSISLTMRFAREGPC